MEMEWGRERITQRKRLNLSMLCYAMCVCLDPENGNETGFGWTSNTKKRAQCEKFHIHFSGILHWNSLCAIQIHLARVLFYHKLFCDGGFVPCLLARLLACLTAWLPTWPFNFNQYICDYTSHVVHCTRSQLNSQPAKPVHQSASEYYSTGRTHNNHSPYTESSILHREYYITILFNFSFARQLKHQLSKINAIRWKSLNSNCCI